MDTPQGPPTTVTYLDPYPDDVPPIRVLFQDAAELDLAKNALWWFFETVDCTHRDKMNLWRQYERRGWNMFLWKYYRVARGYIGGYKALAAHLKLRNI